jgi:UDP-glucuronate decarboxylase
MVRMMASEVGFTGPVNMGNPNEFTIRQLAEIILQLIPESGSKVIYEPLPMDDPKQRQPDITLAREKLGWSPTIKLDDGLVKTIEYFKKIL